MPNLYKMAKAFGRAIVNKSEDNPIRQMANESISKDIGRKFEFGDRNAGDRATAFNRGYFGGGRASRGKQEPYDYYTFGPKDPAAAEVRLDDFTDETTNRSLQNDFEREFNDAIDRASHNRIVKKVMGDNAEDVIRKNAIEMLKSGKSIPDVLDILKMR